MTEGSGVARALNVYHRVYDTFDTAGSSSCLFVSLNEPRLEVKSPSFAYHLFLHMWSVGVQAPCKTRARYIRTRQATNHGFVDHDGSEYSQDPGLATDLTANRAVPLAKPADHECKKLSFWQSRPMLPLSCTAVLMGPCSRHCQLRSCHHCLSCLSLRCNFAPAIPPAF